MKPDSEVNFNRSRKEAASTLPNITLNRTPANFIMRKLLPFLTLLICNISVYPQITFEKTFRGNSYDGGLQVIQTTNGGYIIAGYTQSCGAGFRDGYLLCTDEYGTMLWSKTYGGIDYDQINSISRTGSNGYIMAGSTRDPITVKDSVYLLRINDSGDTLWTRKLIEAIGSSVTQTSDGGFIVGGGIYHMGAGDKDAYLIKTDPDGNFLWIKTYGGTVDDECRSIAQTSDNGLIITGSTYSFGAGLGAVYLIRTDSNGDTLWTKAIGGTESEVGNSVIQTSDGGFVVAGNTLSFGAGLTDVYLIRVDANGNTLWTKTFGGANREHGKSVVQTNDGGFIITGYTASVGGGDVFVIKTNANGDSLWTRTFGGSALEEGTSVVQTTDGGYIISGYTESFGAGYEDIYLIKTDQNGQVAGIDNFTPSMNNRIHVYPCPTTGEVNIQIPRQFGQTKKLEVFDCFGQLQIEKPGDFSDIDISSLVSGLYFFVLTNDENEIQIIKIVKE